MSINRRAVLGGAALAGMAACAQQDTPSKPKTFVMVHGTWHGGWVWKYVREILQNAGHRVFTPTLTGCGEREHLSSPDVGLETHIQDVVNVIRFEELSDIILIGHSFSGVAITGIADRIKDRIRHICFFDALVPRAGRMSGVPRDENGEMAAYFIKRQAGFIDGYKMDYWADYPLKMLLPEDHPKAEWVRSKITTHPAGSWMDELVLHNGGWDGLPRSYIHAVGQAFAKSSEKMIGPARDEGWQFIELDVARDGMVTHPERVAQTFMALT